MIHASRPVRAQRYARRSRAERVPPLRPLLAAALAMMSFGSAAWAAPTYSRAYDQCMDTGDAAQGKIFSIQDCIDEEWGRRDLILNQAYGATMARLALERRTALRQDERHWLAQTERSCFRDQMIDGMLGVMEMHSCHLDRIIARTAWLRRYR